MKDLPQPVSLITWEELEVFFSKEYYSYKLSNKYGEYIYGISLDRQDNSYNLSFIVIMPSKGFPKPKFKHRSLASAKKCAEEHYLLYFA